jgi:uncharacterized protein (DUF58 family)
MPAPLLRALDLDIRRRIDGLLAGDFRATRWGEGTELAQVRPYEPGDDVRQIEWNVTARTGEPHVRVQVAERSLTAWLLLDVSPSMTFGTADRRKADVAEGVALALGHIATRRGNRLGIMTFGGGPTAVMRPAHGRVGMIGLLTSLRREPPPGGSGSLSLESILMRAVAFCRERSAVFVVSDWRGPRDWRQPLMQLTYRHDVIAVEVRDPREQELPDVGSLWLVDPETGRQLRVDTRQRKLRERFAEAAAAERKELDHDLRSARADHLLLSTSGDWLRRLAGFLAARRARR